MTTRPQLRADAERSVRSILEAAERVLAANPAASMAQIASAAGVARTTVHRRFTNRQALVDAMALTAVGQLDDAIDDARPDTSPPLVALHQITVNVLRVKASWEFALSRPIEPGSPVEATWRHIADRCLTMLGRARDAGAVGADVDLDWMRRVYYALITETLHGPDAERDTDELAGRIVDTLLRGFGADV